MFLDFLTVAGQVGTLFLMMGVGYVLARQNWLKEETLSQLSHLLLYVVAPCVIIRALQVDRTPALMSALGVGALVTLATYGLNALLAAPLFPRLPADQRDTLRFGAIYGNVGFMGIPLVQSVLGDSAVIFSVTTLAVFNIYTWTHGIILMGGREHASLRRALVNPGTIGLVIALALFFPGITLPSTVGDAVSFLADLNTPLAMVVIGGQMAGADFGETFRQGRLYLTSALRLLLFPGLTAALLYPLRLDPLLYCATVLLAGCPTAGITGIFAQQFDRDTPCAAQLITLSTLLSILTLPLWALVARRLSGL